MKSSTLVLAESPTPLCIKLMCILDIGERNPHNFFLEKKYDLSVLGKKGATIFAELVSIHANIARLKMLSFGRRNELSVIHIIVESPETREIVANHAIPIIESYSLGLPKSFNSPVQLEFNF